MYRRIFLLISALFVAGCADDDKVPSEVELLSVFAGSLELDLNGITPDVPSDRTLTLTFTSAIDPATIDDGIRLTSDGQQVNITRNPGSSGNVINLSPIGGLDEDRLYALEVTSALQGINGATVQPREINFQTQAGNLTLVKATINSQEVSDGQRVQNVSVNMNVIFEFSSPVAPDDFEDAFRLPGVSTRITASDGDRIFEVENVSGMDYLRQYNIRIDEDLQSVAGGTFTGWDAEFYTQIDSTYKFEEISDEALLTRVQEQTFRYFWDFAHPVSGLARERNTSGDLVTIGGSGFGVMSILVGIERGFITRQEGVDRLEMIVDFLQSADRFHGVWPHWMNGNSGTTIPFSSKDDGADLVETAFMIQGLLAVRQYLDSGNPQEAGIRTKITTLWEEVEWDWFTRGGQDVLYWHWSPNVAWAMNLPIRGWNESLIIYVLAASSPTHPIESSVYHEGWARNGAIQNGNQFYGIELPLGGDRGGPLFFSHYSFLGLDPRNLQDQYAGYWEQNTAHSRINRLFCVQNPLNYVGYGENSWGLTASDNHIGYSAHSPSNDLGVITPTAAISSIPYTPEESMAAIHHFYYLLGDRIWGDYGFKDAFNITENWYADSYLAIDQGPIIVMIENYRTGLLWSLFMEDPEVRSGLDKLGFTY